MRRLNSAMRTAINYSGLVEWLFRISKEDKEQLEIKDQRFKENK